MIDSSKAVMDFLGYPVDEGSRKKASKVYTVLHLEWKMLLNTLYKLDFFIIENSFFRFPKKTLQCASVSLASIPHASVSPANIEVLKTS